MELRSDYEKFIPKWLDFMHNIVNSVRIITINLN